MKKNTNFWGQTQSDLYSYYYDSLSQPLQTAAEIKFLSHIFTKKQKLIELGCGSGRTLIPLLQKGYRIDGLDLSPVMLSKLRRKLAQVKCSACLFQKDLTRFSLKQKYDGANLSQRTLNFITNPEKQRKALCNIAQILNPKARLVINLCPGKPCNVCESQPQLIKSENFTFTPPAPAKTTGSKIPDIHTIELWESWKADQLKQTWDIINEFRVSNATNHPSSAITGKLKTGRTRMQMRVIFVQEMKYLLELTGFKVLGIYGNYKQEPFTIKSADLIFVAGKI